jgi:DNA-binding IscR family transcriptional regulator
MSGKFAISVHILTLLATTEDEWISSEYLAGSININPVLVRKELINLREKGFVVSKEGKSGGNRLAKSANEIVMADVYLAVREKNLLGKSINSPNPACPVGRQINHYLDSLYDETERALINTLSQKKLSEFSAQF